MPLKHVIYPTGSVLYGKSSATASDAILIPEDVNFPGVFLAPVDRPLVFLRAGADFDPADELVADLTDLYYGSVSGGDLYHSRRTHAWDWQNATLLDKLKALYTATDLIEKFNFVGSKTSAAQTLSFPRTRTLSDGTVCQIGGTPLVPDEIIKACYLIADSLVGGRDPQADFESQNVKVETFGPVRTEFATDKGPMQHIANLIPSPSAWALILPFLGISTSFRVGKG